MNDVLTHKNTFIAGRLLTHAVRPSAMCLICWLYMGKPNCGLRATQCGLAHSWLVIVGAIFGSQMHMLELYEPTDRSLKDMLPQPFTFHSSPILMHNSSCEQSTSTKKFYSGLLRQLLDISTVK